MRIAEFKELKNNVSIQEKEALKVLFECTDFTGSLYIKERDNKKITIKIEEKLEGLSYVVTTTKQENINVQLKPYENYSKATSIVNFNDLLEVIDNATFILTQE